MYGAVPDLAWVKRGLAVAGAGLISWQGTSFVPRAGVIRATITCPLSAGPRQARIGAHVAAVPAIGELRALKADAQIAEIIDVAGMREAARATGIRTA